MSNLPQIQDWMIGLLLPSQWVFVYILSFIILVAMGIYVGTRLDEPDAFSGGVAAGMLFFPLFALVMTALGNFTSFMIWLWAGAPA